jgi:hypothetical protein
MISTESILISLANIGAVGYLVKRVVDKVDAHSELLPQVVESQKRIAESLESVDRNQTRLWVSRDDHDRRLTDIEAIHRIHGCDKGRIKR